MLKIFIHLFTIVLSLQSLVNAQSLANRIEKKSSEIDEYMLKEMTNRKIPGLVYGICDKKGLIKANAFGFADIQNSGLVSTNTVFELASLTKQFTAAAIMILVQQNKIKLSDPIKLHLDECPVKWEKITVKHLLTHTSGLPLIGHGYSGFATMGTDEYLGLLRLNLTKEIAFSAMKTDTLEFAPGENFSYSDVGYELLGHIIQKVTGSYRDFIQKSIFDIVGMKDSYLVDQITLHPLEARGYTLRNGELINIRRIWDVEIPSHFGIFSNITDLGKWDSILNTETLLTNKSKTEMWDCNMLNGGDYSVYGYGWFIKKLNNNRIISHTGITGTEIVKFVNDSVNIIVLTNLGIGQFDAVNSWGLAQGIASILGHNTLIDSSYVTCSGLTIKKFNKNGLKKLIGTYELESSKLVRKFYLENRTLVYDRGTAKNVLAELSDGNFIKLGVENEEILEVMSKDFKKLKWKGNKEMLIKVDK